MALEIERKFLVHHEGWNQIKNNCKQKLIRQGYLSTDPEKTIRVRISGNEAFLTIKGKNEGAVRSEFEYTIPLDDAAQLLNHFCTGELSKTRFLFPHGNHTWEIDVFSGKNEGLIVAEIELQSENESFEKPDWIAAEVTQDKRYFNSNLVKQPFCEWE
jgi:CYTH domain-containing protein